MGRARRAKREGRPVDAGAVVLWGVLLDGQIGDKLFQDMETAERVARALREEHPASVVEWAQVGVTLLMRRPLRPKIETVARGALEA